jgi:hypothetical protein
VDSQEVDGGMSRCWARRWGFAKIRSAQTPPRNRRTTEKHHSARGRRRHGGVREYRGDYYGGRCARSSSEDSRH